MNETVAAAQEQYRVCADALLDGLDRAIGPWIERSIAERVAALADREVARTALDDAPDAGRATHDELMPRLRAMLLADVEAQGSGPLSMLRAAVGPATDVLRAAGVPVARRDEFARRAFPDDVYDLGPAAFADVDPDLHDLGIEWGAAKAFLVLARRRT